MADTELAPANDMGEGGADPEAEEEREALGRDRDLLGRKGSKVREKLAELMDHVRQGFEGQANRANEIDDYWDIYNCELNSRQYYNGNAEIYVPIVRDAVDALKTRFTNQLFPPSGNYIEVNAADGHKPFDLISLLHHYIAEAKLKTNVVPAMIVNGYVEGQYNVYVDWAEVSRQIVSRETHGPKDPLTGQEMPGEEIEDITEEEIVEGNPVFEVLHDSDVLILPATVDSVEGALACGGSVTIVRRWTKAKIGQMIDDGAIRDDEGERLKETMGKISQSGSDVEKTLAEHVGIRDKGKKAVVWETWHMLRLGEDGKYSAKGTPRLCRIFFGPEDAILGAKRNPYWNDRCPLLSQPVEKLAGVMKGESPIKKVESLQYEANDAVNEGADTAHYSALPIVVHDPEKGNGPFIMNIAALWEIDPNSIKFMEFPDLTPRAITRVHYCMQAIWQSLGVNPAMMPQQTGRPGAKRNQAEIAMEQQVDLLTTAIKTSVMEEGILGPAMGWVVDLDYQFRDYETVARRFGEMGMMAEMQAVPPLANRNGFSFRWSGVEQAKNAAMQQQQVAWLNVARGMEQSLKAMGYSLNPAPAIISSASSVFGPRIAAQVVVDQRHQMSNDPELENDWMANGFAAPVSPLDDDRKHLQAHSKAMQDGDPHGTVRPHMEAHMQAMQAKMRAMMMQQVAQALQAAGAVPQQPGGAPGPGGPGLPQGGGQVMPPRPVRGPPGMIRPDNMPAAGGLTMPRRM